MRARMAVREMIRGVKERREIESKNEWRRKGRRGDREKGMILGKKEEKSRDLSEIIRKE
jgi:hypothetical protein